MIGNGTILLWMFVVNCMLILEKNKLQYLIFSYLILCPNEQDANNVELNITDSTICTLIFFICL